jgi:hypothetical protein
MKKKYPRIYLGVLLIIPLFLLLLPSNFFDSGDSMCLSIVLFDRECYACGMTRAIQHIIHFDFFVAYQFNKLSVIVFPLIVISYFKEFKKAYYLFK